MPDNESRFIDALELDEFRLNASELDKEKPTEHERFLVVSTLARFASSDVWAGLCGALRDMGFFILPYAMDKLRAFLAIDFMFKDIIATAISVRNNFTHVIFVGSVFIPEWVVKSIQRCGVKVVYWSLEDPHALDQNHKFHTWADYYFTNELKVPEVLDKAIYLPTAADPYACMPPRIPLSQLDAQYRDIVNNDIVFCGNIYPSRQEQLEQMVPFIEQNKYRFGIVGITSLMKDKEKSPLMKYILVRSTFEGDIERLEGVVDHRWLIMMYGYSKIVLNFERDPFYEYNSQYSTNRKYKVIGESLNPRAYEIALCAGGLQMIDDKRKELESGKSLQDGRHCVVFKSIDDLCSKIKHYLTHEKERKAIVDEARKYVIQKHTYHNRAFTMVNKIRIKEGRKDLIIQDIMSRFSNKNGK